MKIFEYGHYFVVFADGHQYEIDGNMGYKNAPWSKVPAQKIYIAKLDNGKITAADTVDPTQTFSGKITKYGRWDQELYNMVERTVLLEALKNIINNTSIQPSTIVMHLHTYTKTRI